MARPAAPLHLSHAHSERSSLMAQPMTPSLTSPLEISQQFARVDALHAQLKAETLRAQEFLLKLHRDECDPPNQAQSKANGRAAHQEAIPQHQNNLQRGSKEQKERDQNERKETAQPNMARSHKELHTVKHEHNSGAAGATQQGSEALCRCSCPHHPLSPASEAVLRKSAGMHNLPLSLHTHVDEREVRDLEKRVRGLEGRVRGLEGLPPDREMALQEVERLRRELEGLARRREGLFEGVSGELVENGGGPKKGRKSVNGSGGKSVGSGQASGKLISTGKTIGGGKR